MKITKQMVDELYGSLETGNPFELDEAQDKRDEIVEAAQAVLKAGGLTEESEDWDDAVDALAERVSWSPGHFRVEK